jgi:hypothetical protein
VGVEKYKERGMIKIKCLTVCAAILLPLSTFASSGANADEILTYTGNDFTAAYTPYTTSMSVTATITLADPLGASFSGDVDPLSFTIMDGVQTITESTYNEEAGADTFDFQTTPEGQISGWSISVRAGSINDSSVINITSSFGDGTNNARGGVGSVGVPGVWSTTISTPEPGTIYVLGSALLGLVILRRHQIRV